MTCAFKSRVIPATLSLVMNNVRAMGCAWLVTLGLLEVSSGAGAQPAVPPVHPPRVVLSDQIELPRLVEMAASRLGVNVEFDPAALTGTVSVRSESGLTDLELWELVNGVLASRGLTTVYVSAAGTYRVVKLADAPSVAGLGRADVTGTGANAGFASVLIELKHRSAKDLSDPVSRLLTKPGGTALPVGDGPLLLVSDLHSRVDQIRSMIELLDTPSLAVSVVEIPIQFASMDRLIGSFGQIVSKRDALAGRKTMSDLLAAPSGTAVLLIAPAAEVADLRQLIAQLDAREPTDTVTYTPRHYAVRDVAPLIEQTVKSPTDDRWKLVIDELTGSLLITATPSQHASVQALLDRLDDAPAAARRPVRTFVIKNRSVMEIQSILENLLRSGVLDAASDAAMGSDLANGQALGATGASQSSGVDVMAMPPVPIDERSRSGISNASDVASGSTPADLRRGDAARRRILQDRTGSALQGRSGGSEVENRPLILSSDEGTNTLIAVGEPRLLAQVESLLVSLDVRQPQVMLEVLIVTLTESQTLDLGVELEYLRIDGETKSRIASLFGLSQRGTDGNPSTGSAAGLSGVVINPGDFSVVLRALETMNNGRAFSMPRLLVGNNQQASLDSVVQQPFASVNASNTVSTTSFGGTQDAGTTVTIKPQIAEGDHLVLDYSVSLSSFLGAASQPTLPPARQQNRVSSAATIPDGYTVVVGGIELEDKGKTVSQVPFLGNVPIIGEAFKSRGKNASRTRFYVFIRANILRGRGFEDLKYISTQDIAKAGLDPGWPTSKPRVIR